MNLMRLSGIWVAMALAMVAATAECEPVQRLLAPSLVGSSVYSVRDLTPEISPSVGKVTSVTVAEQLRDAISARYVRDGYIRPIITIPAADLTSATPRLYIYEARIVDVVIRGDAGPYRHRITSVLLQLRGHALRKESLRQALQQLDGLPGITTRAIFEPQPGMPNEFVVFVDSRYQAVSGEVDVNNAGTSQLGNVLFSGSLFLNDLLGAGEQIQLRAASSSLSDHYQFEDGRIQTAVAGSDVYLEAGHSVAVPDPNVHFADQNATLGLGRPLGQLGAGVLGAILWVHADDDEIHNAALVHLVDDGIRSAALGFTYTEPKSPTPLSWYATVVQGTGSLGAHTLDPLGSEVQIAFTKYLMGIAQSVLLAPGWVLRFNADAQATPQVLPIVERFAFGGLGLGEAFDPASLVGDSGVATGLELGHALPIHLAALESATVFAKADYGAAWSNASYLPSEDQAASFSLGMLGKWRHALISMELSTPLRQPTYAPPAGSIRVLASGAFTF